MIIEQLYVLYLKKCLEVKTGVTPRPPKNFTKLYEDGNDQFFHRLLDMEARSGGYLNLELYIEAQAKFHGGFFPMKALIVPTAMRIYREYKEKLNNKKDPEDIAKAVIDSCHFVVDFCYQKNLTDLFDYLEYNKVMIPAPIEHAYSGKISYFFLACIDTFQIVMKSYPPDSLSLLADFDYNLCRSKIILIPKCRTITNDLDRLIVAAINRKKSQ